jgi:hypothetical protein
MADSKITALDNLTAADPVNDMFPIVDVNDTTMAASGTTKRISVNNLLSSSPTASGALTVTGLVTAGSATITGAATVGTTLGVTGNLTASSNIYVPASVSLKIGPVGSTWGGLRFDSTNQAFLDSDIGITFRTGGASSFTTSYQIGATGISTWSVAGSTAMTLNSTGLGVGGVVTGTGPTILVEGAAGTYAKFNSKVGAKTWSAGYRSGTTQFEIQEDGVERFVIANGGNVGVGVTPSAWSSFKAIELASVGNSMWSAGSNDLRLATNFVYNGGDKYVATGRAATYIQTVGTHQWYSSASGTAGNAITFGDPKMTLDASGNLILLSSNTPATLATNGQLTVNATSNTNLRFSYRGSDGTTRVANITLA